MDYRIEQLRFQVREDPSSRHFYQLGELLRREGELEEAVEVLRTGLKHHPGYVAAWVSLGRTLFQRGRYEECRAAFSRALELDPENAVAATMLGRAAGKCGDWDEAARVLSLASSLVPTDGELAEEAEDARRRANPAAVSAEAVGPAEAAVGGDAFASPFTMAPEDAASPGGEEVTEGSGAGAAGDDPTGPHAGDDAGSPAVPWTGAPEPERATVARSRQVVLVSEEDPWAPVFRGDTGVFETGEDVFVPAGLEAAAGPGEPLPWEETAVHELGEEPEGEPVTGEKPSGSPVRESHWEAGSVEAPEAEPVVEEAVAAPAGVAAAEETPVPGEMPAVPGAASAAGEEAGAEAPSGALEEDRPVAGMAQEAAPAEMEAHRAVSGPEGGPEAAVAPPVPAAGAAEEAVPAGAPETRREEPAGDEIPLPTATLARLALEQDDLELAERTARAVLERDPGSAAAARVLEAVAERRREMRGSPAVLAARKIERLERWLGRIRQLAAGGV